MSRKRRIYGWHPSCGSESHALKFARNTVRRFLRWRLPALDARTRCLRRKYASKNAFPRCYVHVLCIDIFLLLSYRKGIVRQLMVSYVSNNIFINKITLTIYAGTLMRSLRHASLLCIISQFSFLLTVSFICPRDPPISRNPAIKSEGKSNFGNLEWL